MDDSVKVIKLEGGYETFKIGENTEHDEKRKCFDITVGSPRIALLSERFFFRSCRFIHNIKFREGGENSIFIYDLREGKFYLKEYFINNKASHVLSGLHHHGNNFFSLLFR